MPLFSLIITLNRTSIIEPIVNTTPSQTLLFFIPHLIYPMRSMKPIVNIQREFNFLKSTKTNCQYTKCI
jgi:hypothetical protein